MFNHKILLVADNIDDWHNASPVTQLTLFLRLSINIHAILQLIKGPNPNTGGAVVLELQV